MRRVVLLVLLIACRKHDQAAPRAGSGSGVAVAPSGDAGAPAPGLLFDIADDDQDPGITVAFDKKIPRLPAISADATTIADFDSDATGPSIPLPMTVALRKVGSSKVDESLPLVDDKMVDDAGRGEGSNWPPAAVAQLLHTRAAAVLARLHGFRSLTKIELAIESGGEPKETKIGDLTLEPGTIGEEGLLVTLRDAKGGVLHREEIQSYENGTRNVGMDKPVPCTYRPMLSGAYRDPVQPKLLYVEIGYRYSDECDPAEPQFLAFSTEPGPEGPVADQLDLVGVNELDHDSVLAPGALFVGANQVVDDPTRIGVADRAMDYSGHDAKNVQVTVSRDGQSAWASELATVTLLERNQPGKDLPWRASDVVVKTPKGWRIAAAAWTEPVANAKANADAKAGKLLAAQKLAGDPGDQGLRDAFARLATDGVDAAAAARADLVAIGSGPGERTVGGAAFARAWNAAWKGKVTIVSALARTTPSGTTGWVAATIELAKPGYKLPFTVFAVYDRVDGAWTLVHIHFAI